MHLVGDVARTALGAELGREQADVGTRVDEDVVADPATAEPPDPALDVTAKAVAAAADSGKPPPIPTIVKKPGNLAKTGRLLQ